MCSVWEDLIREDRERTRQRDVLEFVKSIVAKTGQSAKDALDLIGIPASEQPKYLSLL